MMEKCLRQKESNNNKKKWEKEIGRQRQGKMKKKNSSSISMLWNAWITTTKEKRKIIRYVCSPRNGIFFYDIFMFQHFVRFLFEQRVFVQLLNSCSFCCLIRSFFDILCRSHAFIIARLLPIWIYIF